MSESILRELYLPHPPRDVWRALTESEAMADWLMLGALEGVVERRFLQA